MSEATNIEWCDSTFNPWIGCTKVSPGCDNCYAARQDAHRRWTPEGWGGPRKRTKTWGDPVKWNAAHEAFFAEYGRRQRVFCASLADWLDNQVPIEWLVDLLDRVRTTPNLDWLLLTKRIGNWRGRLQEAATFRLAQVLADSGDPARDPLWQWLRAWLDGKPPENVRIGATMVNQPEVDRDVVKLLAVPARVRFLSIEPMLGPIDLTRIDVSGDFEIYPLRGTKGCEDDDGNPIPDIPAIDWVICGGESGPGARPMHPDWARSLHDQCAAAGVPFLFKQWGEWLPWSQFTGAMVDDPPEQTRFQTLEYFDGRWDDVGRPGYWEVMDGDVDDEQCVGRVGKRAAGRLLDGVEHNGFPEVTP